MVAYKIWEISSFPMSLKSKLSIYLLIGALIISSFVLMRVTNITPSSPVYEIVHFDLGKPYSFDPLEADSFQNMARARMMFFAPLEVNKENLLSSEILSEYSYNKEKKEITFVVKDKVYYSNGQLITAEDVTLSIKRMLLSRPLFPVIRWIVGKENWLKEQHPLRSLPSGIVVQKNTIKITLAKDTPNPLFRFALELFSVIPSDCIDIDTNLLRKTPPSSGYYIIASETSSDILFQKRKDIHFSSSEDTVPENIRFKFISPSDPGKKEFVLSEFSVLTGMDYRIDFEGLSFLREKLNFKFLPSTSFKTIVINPNVPPLNNQLCRRQFALELRKVYSEFQNHSYKVSSSIFPEIIPGYREESFFQKYESDLGGSREDHSCSWSQYEIPWTPSRNSVSKFDNNVLFKTLLNLGAKVKINSSLASSEEIQPLYEANKTVFTLFRSGFWAQDPVGDTQMIFTPNMHPQLIYVNKDKDLRLALDQLEMAQEEDIDRAMMEINKAIYKDSVMIPVLLSRVFYASSNQKIIADLPQAVVHPAPWHVFNLKYDGE
jgi:hypothetical protein